MINNQYKFLINNQYNFLMKARSTPHNSKEWTDYKRARNTYTNIIRFTKANYWKNKFMTSKSSKSFWSLVKKFKGDSNTNHIGHLKHEDNIVTNESEKANIMNDFFANICKKLATNLVDSNTNMNSYIYHITPSISKVTLSTELLTKSFKAAVREGKAGRL